MIKYFYIILHFFYREVRTLKCKSCFGFRSIKRIKQAIYNQAKILLLIHIPLMLDGNPFLFSNPFAVVLLKICNEWYIRKI